MTDTTNLNTKTKFDIKKMTVLALFIAIAYICLFLFRIKVSFLTLEIKDVFITMTGFLFGPLTAVGVALVEALIEMVSLSDTGIYGAIMNFAGSAAFAGTAAIIYKYRKTLSGAIVGLIVATFAMTGIMIVLNIAITPFYMKAPRSVVFGLIPTLLLPFNVIKGLLNAGILFVIYKPLSTALKSIGMIPKNQEFKADRKFAVVTAVATLVIISAVVLLIALMKGSVIWGR